VAKHAGASRVWIRIHAAETEPTQLVLEVEDNGVGFDPSIARPGHLGLLSMTQRAEALNGRLEVASSPGNGTVIRAVVPIAGTDRSGD
jgi:signal transduction histidine kinase